MLIALSFGFRHSFVMRASSFFNDAFSQCAKDRRFFRSDFFSDKDKFGAIRLERLQLPAPGDEIEKVRAIGEAHEAFCPNHSRGKTICKSFKAIARKSVVRPQRERIEFELMLMLRARDFFLPRLRDAEQQIRIDSAALGEDNCRGGVDFMQLRFERLDLRWLNKIDLVQQQNVRALDLQPGGMTELGKTNEHVGVDYRNDAVEAALWQRLLDVEYERFGFGGPGGFDNPHVGRDFLDDLGDRCLEFAEQRTTDTAAAELGDPDVFAFDDFRVDGNLAEFVHHDGDLRRVCGENVTEQCRLAAAQRTGYESDRSA